MNQPLKLVLPVALAVGGALALTQCFGGPAGPGGGGATGITSYGSGAPTDSGLPGLILAKSLFDGDPKPSTLVLLRPANAEASEWTEEVVIAAPGKVELGLGELADGSTVVCELDAEGEPKTGPMRFVASEDVWSLEPVEGEATWSRGGDGKVSTKTYELRGGNVFHKAMWWDPAYAEPGILTISANMPFLQILRRGAKGWEAEVMWTQIVGGKEQRFRDVEIGDVDGDGQDELVVVTHDNGAVYVLEQTPDGLVPTELHRWEERIFAHEVEIGDADGDGVPEFFTTPSEPNRTDGEHQAGWIDMYRYDAASGEYLRTNIDELNDRHAKEVMAADYDGDGKVELYAALEAEGTDKLNGVRRYTWDGATMAIDETIEIEGKMCRFLVLCDSNGDGQNEIIAATRKAGIFRIVQGENGAWSWDKIVFSYMSGGFEHATYALDLDGDGADELFVASDDQKKVNMFRYNPATDSYKSTSIARWTGTNYFVWNVMPLPAGH